MYQHSIWIISCGWSILQRTFVEIQQDRVSFCMEGKDDMQKPYAIQQSISKLSYQLITIVNPSHQSQCNHNTCIFWYYAPKKAWDMSQPYNTDTIAITVWKKKLSSMEQWDLHKKAVAIMYYRPQLRTA